MMMFLLHPFRLGLVGLERYLPWRCRSESGPEGLGKALKDHEQGVALGRGDATQGPIQSEGVDASGLGHGEALQEFGGHAGGSHRRATTEGLATDLAHPTVRHQELQAHPVAAALVAGLADVGGPG